MSKAIKASSKASKVVVRGRFALDGTAKKAVLKRVSNSNTTVGAYVPTETVEAVAAIKGIDCLKPVETRRGRAVNALGHTIDTACSLGGKNVRVDALLVAVASGKPLTTALVSDTLLASKVVGAKKYTTKAMWAKFSAHKRHFAGKGKVAFTPVVKVDGKAVFNLASDITATVKAVLIG